MESLRVKQSRFVKLVAKLIAFADSKGYQLTFGEAWRTPEQAKLNAEKGIGIANSLHTERLAIDFNLFKDGVWLNKTEDFLELGEYWESLDKDTCWGGRFSKPDGCHFSIEHNGRK